MSTLRRGCRFSWDRDRAVAGDETIGSLTMVL
jgi:hypothetical protein